MQGFWLLAFNLFYLIYFPYLLYIYNDNLILSYSIILKYHGDLKKKII